MKLVIIEDAEYLQVANLKQYWSCDHCAFADYSSAWCTELQATENDCREPNMIFIPNTEKAIAEYVADKLDDTLDD